MTYFVLAKPAVASMNRVGVMSLSSSVDLKHASRLDVVPMLAEDNVDDEGSGKESGDHDCASTDVEMDDFIVAPAHFDFGTQLVRFENKDLHLSLPAFERGLDWPPELA